MAKWVTLLNLRGSYTSLPFSIPMTADGMISSIDWHADVPTGSGVTVQIRYKADKESWSPWHTCTAKAEIPSLDENTPVDQMQFMYRITLSSSSYDISPSFHEISFNMEPVIVFDNQGDTTCKPEIWITKVGHGDFTINNLSRQQPDFTFYKLLDKEQVYVNNDQQHIETSLPVVYRYQDFNDNYLQLHPGKNILSVHGEADIKFRYQYTYL